MFVVVVVVVASELTERIHGLIAAAVVWSVIQFYSFNCRITDIKHVLYLSTTSVYIFHHTVLF